jgi:hypothetical protein
MKTLRYSLIVIAAVILCFLLSGCGQGSSEPGSGMTYPLHVGSSWQYEGGTYYYNYRMIGQPPQTNIDTMYILNCSTYIAGLDTIYDSLEVYIFRSSVTYSYTWNDSVFTRTAAKLFGDKQDGFYDYGYISAIDPYIAMPDLSPSDLTQPVNNILPFGKNQISVVLDSFIFENPPRKCLEYPLTVGAEWFVRQSAGPWRILKRVIGQQEISTPAGIFDCLVIEWKYDTDNNGIWDTDIEWLDYLSEQGLIKRSMIRFNSRITDELGNLLGYYDSKDEIWLTGYVQ